QLFQCKKEKLDVVLIRDTAYQLVKATTPYLGKNDLTKLWKTIQTAPCYKRIPYFTKVWLDLHKEIATQNFSEALKFAKIILNKFKLTESKELNEYLFAATLISAMKTNELKLARSFWQAYSPLILIKPKEVPLSLTLLQAHLNAAGKN
ncbi:MAG: hypothetical protein KAU29_11430, partial [Gammaproteobacteria bacterium]|nr:hypothetical protein [Gammaproteobacteria bacterium]